MELDEKTQKKLSRVISKYEKESRALRKDSDDYEVVEEVFDKKTYITLHHLLNSKVIKCLNGVVSSGKEARVYWGQRDDGSSVAVKIYLTVTVEFKKRLPYIVGDPRFKKVKRGSRNIVELWAQKEYKNLMTVYDAGIPAPRPLAIKKNVLVMEFIGEDGSPAPLLHEVDAKQNDYRRIISLIKRLFKNANLVHADLSEYNIFKYGRRLILFDFGSAVDVRHPFTKEFLIRDITNVNRFFSKRGLKVEPLERVLKKVGYT
ncbi:MAG: serine protein kinase RIO [Candidatus Methylarchaceae archaeon HK02M2]|nr:serine protein kinase RIO [Candidatus Methylarchaceae archaeon HK02M2]